MENATKALLIAASVLIAIVLIAFGIKILGSTGDAGKQAQNVQNSLNNQIGNYSNAATSGIDALK